MTEKKTRTVLATTEDLRLLVLSLYAGITFASGIVSVVLCLGWLATRLSSSYQVPILLPVLAIASIGFTVVMWSSYADAARIGRAYRTQATDDHES